MYVHLTQHANRPVRLGEAGILNHLYGNSNGPDHLNNTEHLLHEEEVRAGSYISRASAYCSTKPPCNHGVADMHLKIKSIDRKLSVIVDMAMQVHPAAE